MNTGNKPRLWIRTVIRRHYERVGKTFRIEFWVWRFDHLGSQLVVKLLGLIYRLVITNIDGFGDVVNGYYNAGFQIYTLLLALSSVGIPSAISKLVARAETAGNQRRSEDVFRTAMALFFGIGLLSAAALYLGADLTACFVIQMNGVQGTLRPLSPAVLFACLSSVLQGYYLGLGSAKATGSSQVAEQLLKSVLTVVTVLALTGYSAQAMSAERIRVFHPIGRASPGAHAAEGRVLNGSTRPSALLNLREKIQPMSVSWPAASISMHLPLSTNETEETKCLIPRAIMR